MDECNVFRGISQSICGTAGEDDEERFTATTMGTAFAPVCCLPLIFALCRCAGELERDRERGFVAAPSFRCLARVSAVFVLAVGVMPFGSPMERPLPVRGRTVFLGFTTLKDDDREWERKELDKDLRVGSCDNEKASLAGRAMSSVQLYLMR